MRFSSLFGLVLSELVLIVLQSFIYIIVDKEFIVVVCDVLLITEYKWDIFLQVFGVGVCL